MKPLHQIMVIDKIIQDIKTSCESGKRTKNVLKLNELVKISPMLNKFKYLFDNSK
jgi:hypothetical protein